MNLFNQRYSKKKNSNNVKYFYIFKEPFSVLKYFSAATQF